MATEHENRVLTLGERRVRLGFNPSSNPSVDQIKRLAADIIDLCEDFRRVYPNDGEAQRLFSLAQTHA